MENTEDDVRRKTMGKNKRILETYTVEMHERGRDKDVRGNYHMIKALSTPKNRWQVWTATARAVNAPTVVLKMKSIDKNTEWRMMEPLIHELVLGEHAHILHIHTAFCTPRDGIVMETDLCQETVTQLVLRMHKKALEVRVVQTLLKQLLLALAHCHSRFVIHGDVKLDNLLLTRDGTLKLADFGASQWVGCDAMMPHTYSICAEGYKPPEILTRNRYTWSVDIWAAGRCVCDMLHIGNGHICSGTMQQQLDVVNRFAGPLPPEYLTDIKPTTNPEGLFVVFGYIPAQLQPLLAKMHVPHAKHRICARAALLDPFFVYKFN